MKKKLLAITLAGIMTLGLLPLTAMADELPKLATPTELTWGRNYKSDGTYTEYPGMMSCKVNEPHQRKIKVDIYRKSDSERITGGTWAVKTQYVSRNDFIMADNGDLEDGEYYFTLQAIGDGVNYTDSDIAVSETWMYTRPESQLPKVEISGWNWPNVNCKSISENDLLGEYEVKFYYSSEESGDPTKFCTNMGIVVNDLSIPDSELSRNGAGYYYFTVRALSADITKTQNGPWSEMSPAYCLTETMLYIESELNKISRNGNNADEIRAQVQALDKRELKEAMLADNTDTSVIDIMKKIEKSMGEVNISVNDGMSEKIPADGVSIAGALLNNVDSDDVTLNIGEPKNKNDINPALYNDTVAVSFSMGLDGVKNPDNLEVPVKLVIPIPENINPDFLVILHYPVKGGAPEEVIRPYCFEKDGQWYASFVLDHFSDFVMTEKVKPAYKTGDVNADTKVDAKDKAILNRYLAGWAGYEDKILSRDAADIDGSGKVDAKDKAILNRYLAGWSGYDEYFE